MNRLLCVIMAGGLAATPCLARNAQSINLTDLDGHQIAFPAGLSAQRTLVLVAFKHSDQEIIQGWKSALSLQATQNDWLELPVVGVSNGLVKGMIRSGMRSKYPAPQNRIHVAPLFGDAAGFARDLGIAPNQVAVLVVDRQGHVLASATGVYSSASAQQIKIAWHPQH